MVNMLLPGAMGSYILCVMALEGYLQCNLTNRLLISIAQNKLKTLENSSATTIIGA